ncbi:MAG: D-arabinono-1,4-lactone oxidase [Aureispira sp.]
MDKITYAGGILYLPETEADIQTLIQQARSEGKQLRVRGSAHSVKSAIYTTDFGDQPDPKPGIDLLLSKMRALTWNDAEKQVTAQAGVNLGRDPFDPSGISTKENSLFYQMDQRGWAIKDMGGIIHQTVGGFTSTGSAGGSLQTAYTDAILKIKMIDGNGQVQVYERNEDPNNHFFAVGTSLGLLGIITEITYQCVDRFDIKGQQITSSYDNGPIDFFGPGDGTKPSMLDYLKETEYARLLWWPQQGVQKFVTWEAAIMKPSDYNSQTNPPSGPPAPFKPKPYLEFPEVGGSQIPAQLGASLFYWLVGNWPTWFHTAFEEDGIKKVIEAFLKVIGDNFLGAKDYAGHLEEWLQQLVGKIVQEVKSERGLVEIRKLLATYNLSLINTLGLEKRLVDWLTPDHLEDPTSETGFLSKLEEKLDDIIPDAFKASFWEKVIELLYEPVILPFIINLFQPEGTVTFWDTWWQGLPMDNKVNDIILPTEFTEIWIDAKDTQAVMNTLLEYYNANGLSATGSYTCELYATTANKFWMNAAYNRDVFRVDLFWYAYNEGDPGTDYYPQFWELLKPFDFRLHWGKYLAAPDSSTGTDYLKAQYPKWDDFMALRTQLDPDNIFVSDYWSQHLGISV